MLGRKTEGSDRLTGVVGALLLLPWVIERVIVVPRLWDEGLRRWRFVFCGCSAGVLQDLL